jgi:hypothetical protein
MLVRSPASGTSMSRTLSPASRDRPAAWGWSEGAALSSVNATVNRVSGRTDVTSQRETVSAQGEKSRMKQEAHIWFCEDAGVQFPCATDVETLFAFSKVIALKN